MLNLLCKNASLWHIFKSFISSIYSVISLLVNNNTVYNYSFWDSLWTRVLPNNASQNRWVNVMCDVVTVNDLFVINHVILMRNKVLKPVSCKFSSRRENKKQSFLPGLWIAGEIYLDQNFHFMFYNLHVTQIK